MKLLLTSGGLTNDSIANALFELVGKKPENTKGGIFDTFYVMDDQSALRIVDGKIDVITEGEWFVINR